MGPMTAVWPKLALALCEVYPACSTSVNFGPPCCVLSGCSAGSLAAVLTNLQVASEVGTARHTDVTFQMPSCALSDVSPHESPMVLSVHKYTV